MCPNASQRLSAIGRISSGSDAGTRSTQAHRSTSGMRETSSIETPMIFGARAASENLEPLQSGQTSNLRKRSTRFMPDSSFTLASAFSTVFTAEKYVKSSSAASFDPFG